MVKITGNNTSQSTDDIEDIGDGLWGDITADESGTSVQKSSSSTLRNFFTNSDFARRFKSLLKGADPQSQQGAVPQQAIQKHLHHLINGDYKNKLSGFLEKFKMHIKQ